MTFYCNTLYEIKILLLLFYFFSAEERIWCFGSANIPSKENPAVDAQSGGGEAGPAGAVHPAR